MPVETLERPKVMSRLVTRTPPMSGPDNPGLMSVEEAKNCR